MLRVMLALIGLATLLSLTASRPSVAMAQNNSAPSNALLTGSGDWSARAAAAMMWLADHQNSAGFWNPTHFQTDSKRGAFQAQTIEGVPEGDRGNLLLAETITSLSVLALMESGSTTKDGIFAPNLQRAMRWLIARQQPDGRFGKAMHTGWIVNHTWAMVALARMNDADPQEGVTIALGTATDYLLAAQGDSAGMWGFGVRFHDDNTYATSLALIALQANQFRNVPDIDTIKKVGTDFIANKIQGSQIRLGTILSESKLIDGSHLQNSLALNAVAAYALDDLYTSPKRVGSGDFNMALLNEVVDAAADNVKPDQDPWQAFEALRAIEATRRQHKILNIRRAFQSKVMPIQYGYSPAHLAKLPTAATPAGRRQLDEHGAFAGEKVWNGGRVLTTALHALSFAILARDAGETFAVTTSGVTDASKSVEWDNQLAGFSGSIEEAEAALWNLVADNEASLKREKIEYQRGREGKLTTLRSASLDKVIRTNDLDTMNPADGGEVVFIWYETNATGTTRVAFIPRLAEERVEGEGRRWVSRFSSIGQGAADPRYPWRQIVSGWFAKLPSTLRTKQHYAGLAFWLSRNYATFAFADGADPGHVCWSGYTDELLYQGFLDAKLSMKEAMYLAGFIRGNKDVAEGRCTYFHDSFLDSNRFEARKAVSQNPESWLYWWDAAFLELVNKRPERSRWDPVRGGPRDKILAAREEAFVAHRDRILAKAE